MIISRTPLRISFAGGGSDLPAFYKKYPGAVLSTAIDKYIFITVNKKFDNKIRISYSKTEIVENIKDIKHDLVRESLKKVGINGGIEITSIADIPSEGSGLGSSSSYIVGLLNAFYAFKGIFTSPEILAKTASDIEINILKRPVGKQDHYIAAYGGLQYILFNPDNSVFINPVICKPQIKNKLYSSLLLFYTGITRSSAKILKKQSRKIKNDKKVIGNLVRMTQLATEMKQIIERKKINEFGYILNQNWELKKQLELSISNSMIDNWYKIAINNGASGGKILGAGGGGFMLIYSDKKYHKKIIKALSKEGLRLFRFNLEPQGSKIIYIH